MFSYRCGQNPTGSTLTVERRKQIYSLAQKFDLIIVEDGSWKFFSVLRILMINYHSIRSVLLFAVRSIRVGLVRSL